MSTFIMFGTYSAEAMDDISSTRTEKAVEIIEELGGKVIAMYALLGEPDLMIIMDMPSPEAAMKTSIKLSKETGIGFITSQAVSVGDFDILFS
ncbi:MAG: GYD domain-containing protein [Candidatus Marinimicrobia bacterium]|nr:GYD domain-containing protein [Candidatus Neomarinimicrobiota bacterium]